MNIKWHLKHFDELTAHELFYISQLRIEVFIVEQNCIYEELDNKDLKAFHLFAIDLDNNKLIAYTRNLNIGISYENYASIGRVVVSKEYRKDGLGKKLMLKSIEALYKLFGKQNIKISAQQHLEKFYNSLNFVTCSETYLEDGIPHISMKIEI